MILNVIGAVNICSKYYTHIKAQFQKNKDCNVVTKLTELMDDEKYPPFERAILKPLLENPEED